MTRKILIVDDDPHALRLLSYAFACEGYEIVTATNGAEALATLSVQRPDLVLLDVMMPDMSGLEVCQRIRASRATARLPILMLSARGQVSDRVSGLKSGADDYVPKPADTDELLARAAALLARAEASAAPAGQVLAFFGAKGGTGTTTVAVNVATQLARQAKSVILVELRPGVGCAAALLKLQPVHDLGSLLDRAPAEISASDIQGFLLPHASGLRLLAAPQTVDGRCEISADLVGALLAQMMQDADYVVVDLPPSWSPANLAAVRLSRVTGVVCEPEPLSIGCARATVATLQRWGIMGDLVGLIVVNRGVSASPLTLPAIRAAVSAGLLGAVPPAVEACAAAVKEGEPLVELFPQHVAAVALKELAGRLSADRIRPLP